MGRELNISLGRIALGVLRTFNIRASNRDEYGLFEEWELEDCIDEVRALGGKYEVTAAATKAKKCGNCGEMTAVLMTILQDMKVGPREQMILWPNTPFAHSFAVIGRPSNSDSSDPSTWGPDAVVIDPWHNGGKVYAATEMKKEMFRGAHNHVGAFQPQSQGRSR